MVNQTLLKEVLEYIKSHPEEWRQEWFFVYLDDDGEPVLPNPRSYYEELWACRTAYCFAGHAAIRTGFPPPPVQSEYGAWGTFMPNGDWVEVDTYAQKALGLTSGQASVLFDPSNTIEDLETIVDAIIDDPDITGMALYPLTSWWRQVDEDDYYDDDDDDGEYF